MARQRLIRPEFFSDERLASCPPHARLLFAGLWGLADKRGRLRDQPPVIHGAVFPFEPTVEIEALLVFLQDAGSILRYTVDGKKYIQVKNFERFQKPHPKEAESVIPGAPPLYRAEPGKDTAEPVGIRSFVPSKPSVQPPLTPPDGGEFDLPPGLGRKRLAPGLERIRQQAIFMGFRPDRKDLRQLRAWLTAGYTDEVISTTLKRIRESGLTIAAAAKARI